MRLECGCEIRYVENEKYPRGHLEKKFCDKHKSELALTLADLYNVKMRFADLLVRETFRLEERDRAEGLTHPMEAVLK